MSRDGGDPRHPEPGRVADRRPALRGPLLPPPVLASDCGNLDGPGTPGSHDLQFY